MFPQSDIKNQALALYRKGDLSGCEKLIRLNYGQVSNDVEVLLLIAAIRSQQADYQGVVEYCLHVLEIDGDNVIARYNIGLANYNLRNYRAAYDEISKVINVISGEANVLMVYYGSLLKEEDYELAVNNAKEMLARCGYDIDIVTGIINIFNAGDAGRYALDLLDDLLSHDPGNYQYASLKVRALLNSGDQDGAKYLLGQMNDMFADSVDLTLLNCDVLKYINIRDALDYIEKRDTYVAQSAALKVACAKLYFSSRNFTRAEELFKSAMTDAAYTSESLHYLGDIEAARDRYPQAIDNYEKSLRYTRNANTIFNLALMYEKLGDAYKAFQYVSSIVSAESNDVVLQYYVHLLSLQAASNIGEQHIKILYEVSKRRIGMQDLSRLLLEYSIHNNEVLKKLYLAVEAQSYVPAFDPGEVFDAVSMRLLLVDMVITDVSVERLLTVARKQYLMDGVSVLSYANIPLLSALSLQCYLNGYVYYIDETEQEELNNLMAGIAPDDEYILLKCILATLYMPLYDVLMTVGLPINSLPQCESELFDYLLKLQYYDKLRDEEIADTIDTDEIDDAVSNIVRQQYEENPYPVWIKVNVTQQQSLESIINAVTTDEVILSVQVPRVLIAGCGTGSHAIQNAIRMKSKSVTAIDLSRASLAYAIRKADEYGYSSIDFKQLDILNVSRLGCKFDVIESVGVIHHMQDPEAGLAALLNCLEDGGLLCLGLYSTLARRNIELVRQELQLQPDEMTESSLRVLRRDIIDGHYPHIDVRNIAGFNDFYSMNECRDLISHVQEKTYTISELILLLEKYELEFLGFEMTDFSIKRKYLNVYPEPGSLSDLEKWNDYEIKNPDTFSEMYVFWCRRKSRVHLH